MTLDTDIIRKACLELWHQYHDKIEEKGYSLGKESFIQSPEGFTIVASIGKKCPEEMLKYFRQVIPEEFDYYTRGMSEAYPVIIKTYPVVVSPSLEEMFGF